MYDVYENYSAGGCSRDPKLKLLGTSYVTTTGISLTKENAPRVKAILYEYIAEILSESTQ